LNFTRILIAVFALGLHAVGSAQDSRPNVLVLVADDLGYADLGVYGGDIRTPNIDSLAATGLLFTQFHTAPLCSPTRAMLLSGNNNHVAGIGRQQNMTPNPITLALDSHTGTLSERVGRLPELLRTAGYHTLMAGKWHLGSGESNSPPAAGFDRSYIVEDGAANHFNTLPWTADGSVFRENGKLVQWPENAYSTELYTDKLIEYIEADRDSGRPFFAYAAYTSPHWPLQVPEDELDLYSGRYDMGYDSLREQRFESLRSANIIPTGSRLPPRNDAIPVWDELSEAEKRGESREMELYAAMVDNLDRHIGRLLDYLRDTGLYEDTLIVFMADNGAAAGDFYNSSERGPFLQAIYDNSYDNMGYPDSFVSYGPAWAEAGSAPFSRYKGFTTEGGLVAPMIITGPGVARDEQISREYLTVADLAPTFLELAGARYPADKVPMVGESAWSYLSGRADSVHDDEYVTVISHAGRAFLRRGNYKLVNSVRPFDEQNFELFDVIADPGETTDLSDSQPELRTGLIGLWRTERRRLGIVLPEDL
jgi:arylsulfatase